jgi:hypothetical protein
MVNSKKIFTRRVTFERLSATAAAKPAILFCTGCDLPSEMLPISEAAAEAEISMKKLFRLSEDGLVHSVETDSGQMLICRQSLNELKNGASS